MPSRLYRLLLWILPVGFRRRFADRMASAFERRLREARARGPGAVSRTWWLGLQDLAETAAVAWRDHLRSGRVDGPTGRRRYTASPSVPREPPQPRQAVSVDRDPPDPPPPAKEPMNSFLQDLKYTVRSLRAALGFTVVSVSTLALGIGAVTAIFSVVNGVLLRPLPYEEPEELVLLWSRNPGQGQERYFISPPNFADWRAQNTTFERFAGFWPTHYTLTEPGADPARLRAAMVTGEFFDTLGTTPFLGRLFGPDDEGADATFQAVLSHSFWRNRFNGDEEVVGKVLTLDGDPYEVIGVTRPGFAFPEDAQLWINMAWDLATTQARYARWMTAIGRLEPGVTLAEAQADMDVLTTRLAREYPGPNEGWSSTMAPLHEVVVGDVRPALLVLLGATGLILLIACANVANLQLSRSETRQREIAVRSALGAGRARIGRQLLTESLGLAALGALLGLALAWAALRALIALSPPDLPRIGTIGIDATVLFFAVASTLLTGLLFGMAPAWRLLGTDVNTTLREGTRGTASHEKLTLRNGFVVMEVALAVMLVIGAGLLIRSFGKLQAFDPGFNAENVLTLMIDLPQGSYPDDAQVARFYQRLEERLTALPDVQVASTTSTLPLDESVDYYASFTFPDREPPPPGEQNQAYFRQVGHDFFRAMGIRLLSGRSFTERDRADAPGVAIINETLADRYWPDEDPVGDRLTGTQDRFGPLGAMLHDEVEIVGVVEDVRYVGFRENPQPSLYFPARQAPFRRMSVIARTSRPPEMVVGSVRAAVAELDPALPISRIATMEQVLARSVSQDRFSMLLLLLFGAAALVLATVGIYGVLSYNVEQRTRELGIRMALGAGGEEVRGLVLRQATAMIAVGLAVGLTAAFWLSRVLESQLFGVGARDPMTFAGVTALLGVVALAASWLPARRATSVDPIVALRNE